MATRNWTKVPAGTDKPGNPAPTDWQGMLATAGIASIPLPRVGDTLPQHAQWQNNTLRYNFFDTCVRGGPNYKNGRDAQGSPILFEFSPRETADGFNRRRRIGLYINYCKPIINRFNNFIFRGDVRRDGDPDFTEWCKNVDLMGTSLPNLMRFCTYEAQKFGMFLVGIDSNSPRGKSMTVSQAKAAGVQLFAQRIDPRRMINWRQDAGVLTEALIVYGGGEKAILWTATLCHVLMVDKAGKVTSIETREHGYPGLPIFNISPFGGLSQIEDVAEINRDMFNLDSLLREELINSTFTQHFAIGVRAKELEEQEFGSDRFVCLPNKDARIDTVGGDPAQADSLRKSITDDKEAIFICAGLKAESPLEIGVAKSGVALRMEFDEIDAQLTAIANEAERVENLIIKFYNFANNQHVAESDYADSFGAPDMQIELARSLNVLSSTEIGPTARQLESIRLNGLLHPKATPQQRAMMDAESALLWPSDTDIQPMTTPEEEESSAEDEEPAGDDD